MTPADYARLGFVAGFIVGAAFVWLVSRMR